MHSGYSCSCERDEGALEDDAQWVMHKTSRSSLPVPQVQALRQAGYPMRFGRDGAAQRVC